jgi:hypothetical protein
MRWNLCYSVGVAKRPPKQPVTRATLPSVAERIERIVAMMFALEWERGRSAPVLAQEWGLAVATVEGHAAEASRIVARSVADVDAVKADVAVTLLENLKRASSARKFGDVAKLGDVVTRVLGARAPEQHTVTMTEEQARAKWQEITGHPWSEDEPS